MTEEITYKKFYVNKCIRCYRRNVYGGIIRKTWDAFFGKLFHKITWSKTKRFNRKCYKFSIKNIKILEAFIDKEKNAQAPVNDAVGNILYGDNKEVLYDIEKLIQSEENTMNELLQKEITIALLGKTKAGKSSIFSLMTGYGQEFIGEGLQRTTRFATTGFINGIRVTDTPGLGAMDEQGRIGDEKKAMNILETADLICVVIPTDSISTELKDTIKKIAKKNKPIHIIFNKKGTDIFEFEQVYQEFMKNPYGWMCDDKIVDNMHGHKNDLLRYAEKNNFKNILQFDYVHAYMARVAKNQINTDWHIGFWEKKKLLKASNYKNIVSHILKRSVQNYKYYRWQQYFNSMLYTVNEIINKYSAWSSQVSEQRESLEHEKEEALGIIDTFKKDLVEDSKREIQNFIWHKKMENEEKITKAVASSKKKYVNYLEQYCNGILQENENILQKVFKEKWNGLIESFNHNGIQMRYLYSDGDLADVLNKGEETDIETEPEEGLVKAKDVMRGLRFISKIAFLWNPGVNTLASGIDMTLGLMEQSSSEPSFWKRKEQRSEQRKGEIDNILSDKIKERYGEIEKGVDEWKKDCKNKYEQEIQSLQNMYDSLSDKEKKLEDIKKRIIDKYAKCYLKLRHKGAKFVVSDICEDNKMIIKAKYCKPEIINETYCRIEIINDERGRIENGTK